ncbi:MAG: tyrosine-type recombinase/integrase [Erysipelotrichaceae bacterium]|nr:tyrosine-type recombinase/integrase [Erysipelotrichaceae bacterium]
MPVYRNKTNSTWYIKFNNTTKRGFHSKKEALLYEAKLKLSEEVESTDKSSKEVSYDYLSYKRIKVSFGTYDKNRNSIERHILPFFESDKSIAKITNLDCRKYYETLDKLNYSTVYKNDVLLTFKSIFKHAEKYFNLKSDPTRFVERFKPSFDEQMKKKEKETNIWSDEDFRKFISEIDNQVYKELFVMLYYTGMRLGEALALTWNDFHDNCVSISKSITRKTQKGSYEVRQPKNVSSYRTIGLGSNLSKEFIKFKNEEIREAGFTSDWFMFGRNKPLVLVTIDRVKEAAIKKARVKRIRIHDLRHSHASNLIASGANIVAVSRRLGHSDVNITLKVYTHLFMETELNLINMINSAIIRNIS